MIINSKEYKQYDEYYFVSAYGDVWSKYSQKELKHYIDCDGYHRVDIHGKHIKVHKLVYLTWIGNIPNGLQINHKDDDKNNNHYSNLYVGTQSDNIQDCIRNKHRKGNIKTLIIKEKDSKNILFFTPANDFMKYCQHTNQNHSLKRILQTKWFNEKYELIYIGKSVTTIESIV